MKPNATDDSAAMLDRAVGEIRGLCMPAEEEEAVLARVSSALCGDTAINSGRGLKPATTSKPYLTGCEDFQSLIPGYLASALPPSRTLLLQDHLMECAVCWKIFESNAGRPGASTATRRSPLTPDRRWKTAAALAAACILLALVLTNTSLIRNFWWPADVNASVESVHGTVYLIVGRDIQTVSARQPLHWESIRTGPASGAVLEMGDGSRIEMNERTELNLTNLREGIFINLRRGNIIVAAAKQHGGRLYVSTPDSKVSVVGTLFAVTTGAKGSRVSVIEGQVQVQYGAGSQAVAAGQQVRTSQAMPPAAFPDELRWSRNLNKYAAMLRKFALASRSAAQSLERAGLRYTSSLVPVVPEDSVLVASFPNVEGSIIQSQQMLAARISENTLVDRWWNRHRASVDAMVRVVSRVSSYLGPEIVIAAPLTTAASAPVVLANVTSPEELAAALRNDPVAAGGQVFATVNGGLVVLSSSPAQIQKTLGYQAQFGTNRFQSTALYQRLAKSYTEGVGWLLAADLERIVGQDPATVNELQNVGWENMRELVVEQKTGTEGPAFFQTIGFKQARTGMLGWLAEPSTMGALEFVSATAYAAAGVITIDPNLILDSLFTTLRSLDGGRAFANIEKFQLENNVDIRRDVASSLGNELLVAIDGPVLPSPSWKVVLEINDPARLQNALSWSFNELNRRAAIEHKPRWIVNSESRPGWIFYSTALEGSPDEIHYAFLGGYLVITPNRQMLADTVKYWITGTSLGRSPEFRRELPADGRTDFSGFVYHNIKSVTDAVPGGFLSGVNVKFPTLICLYGYSDRLVMSSKGVLGTDIVSAEGLEVLTAAIGRR